MLRVYIDESGTHGNSPVVSVGAYIGRPEQWQKWEEDWNIAKRSIKVYHAADAEQKRGEFNGWTESQITEVVRDLIDVIVRSGIVGVAVGIHLKSFYSAMQTRPDLQVIFPSPYAACLHWTVQTILNLQSETNSHENIEFIHEINQFRKDAIREFEFIRSHTDYQCSIRSNIIFATKQEKMPLQAADIIAFESNKRFRDPSRPERRPWKMLSPRIAAYHYGESNMNILIDILDSFNRSGT